MEIPTSVDQRAHPAMTLIARWPELFARQGSVVATWRQAGARRHGPYFQLAYREGERQRRVYLGVAGPIVEAVRGALERLQRPLRGLREFQRMRRKLTASLRAAKSRLAGELQRLGLRLKGFEVRGWRGLGLGRLDATALERRAGRRGTGPCFRSACLSPKSGEGPKNGPVPARPEKRAGSAAHGAGQVRVCGDCTGFCVTQEGQSHFCAAATRRGTKIGTVPVCGQRIGNQSRERGRKTDPSPRGIASFLARLGLRPPRVPRTPRSPSPAQVVGRLLGQLLPRGRKTDRPPAAP